MNEFQPFVMERMMSKYEQEVDYNLSESGVHPILLRELLNDDPVMIQRLLETDINYPYANGNPQLRQNIALMYDGATEENVLVTVGSIEANYNTVRTLLSRYLSRPRIFTIMGFDPMYQLIHERDFARAIEHSLRPGLRGVFNVTGPGEVPLQVLIRHTGATRVPGRATTSPSTRTRPAAISSSQALRDATPARAKYFCSLIASVKR